MFTLTINTDGASFRPGDGDDPELDYAALAALLHRIADRLDVFAIADGMPIPVLDPNGNTVGHYAIDGPGVAIILRDAVETVR